MKLIQFFMLLLMAFGGWASFSHQTLNSTGTSIVANDDGDDGDGDDGGDDDGGGEEEGHDGHNR